jgi:hypothetical protein
MSARLSGAPWLLIVMCARSLVTDESALLRQRAGCGEECDDFGLVGDLPRQQRHRVVSPRDGERHRVAALRDQAFIGLDTSQAVISLARRRDNNRRLFEAIGDIPQPKPKLITPSQRHRLQSCRWQNPASTKPGAV